MDDFRATLAGFHHKAEADRVALSHIRALNDDAVAIDEVPLGGGRAATSEAGTQTGYSGTVSDTGLVGDVDDAQVAEQLEHQIVFLVVEGRPANAANALQPVDAHAIVIVHHEILVARLF